MAWQPRNRKCVTFKRDKKSGKLLPKKKWRRVCFKKNAKR